jgi:hypothetical protein
MFGVKHYELKAGRQLLAVRSRTLVEKKMQSCAAVSHGVVQVAVNKHFWTGLSTFFCKKFVEKVWLHPHVRKVTTKATDVVRGKKEIKSTGPISFYLKDVSDHKNKVRAR